MTTFFHEFRQSAQILKSLVRIEFRIFQVSSLALGFSMEFRSKSFNLVSVSFYLNKFQGLGFYLK